MLGSSAMLRVGWIVAGCAPAVRTIVSSNRFHWTTGFTICAEDSAARAARLVHRSARKAAPIHFVFVSRRHFFIFGIGYLRFSLGLLRTVRAPWRRRFSTVYTHFLDGLFPNKYLLNWE